MPLLAVALVLAGALAIGVVHVAAAASRRGAAQAAADASALAGAAEGRDAAEAVAAANGARVLDYREIDLDVLVVVRRGDAIATARARWAPTPRGEGP